MTMRGNGPSPRAGRVTSASSCTVLSFALTKPLQNRNALPSFVTLVQFKGVFLVTRGMSLAAPGPATETDAEINAAQTR